MRFSVHGDLLYHFRHRECGLQHICPVHVVLGFSWAFQLLNIVNGIILKTFHFHLYTTCTWENGFFLCVGLTKVTCYFTEFLL